MTSYFLPNPLPRRRFLRQSLALVATQSLSTIAIAQTLSAPTNLRFGTATTPFPTASNTGVPAGTTLTSSGSITVSAAGAVIDARNISGTVNINASNVTLRRCKITATGYFQIQVAPGLTGVVIEDCEVNGVGSNNDGSLGIYLRSGGHTVRRNNVYNVENGITLASGSNPVIIQDNYVHDLLASGSPHYDGIQIDGGVSNVTIEHNTIINPFGQTAAVMIDNYFGPISNIKVNNNKLVGGGYTVYSDGQFSGGTITGVSFTNNRFGKGQWGYRQFVNNTPTWTGNVDDVTGNGI